MSGKLLLVAAVAVTAVPLCYAADSPWNGTWKMNNAKSQRTGDIDTLSQGADGKYIVATSGLTLSFSCDGKDYPMPGGRTMSCVKVNDATMHTVFKMNGTELATVDRALADNGGTMNVVSTGKAPDGTSFRNTEVYKKISTGQGDAWTGKWQSTKVETSTRATTVVRAAAHSVTFEYPMEKTSLTAKLDGTPTSEQGMRAERGLLVSLTAAGPLTIKEVDTLDGKVLEHDTLSVSPDGKTMTIEVQRTGGKAKQVYVYDKQ